MGPLNNCDTCFDSRQCVPSIILGHSLYCRYPLSFLITIIPQANAIQIIKSSCPLTYIISGFWTTFRLNYDDIPQQNDMSLRLLIEVS